jgi:signal peptidase I
MDMEEGPIMTTPTAGSPRTRSLAIAVAWIAGLILAGLIVLRLFIYEPFRIPSDSMYPTVPNGSFLIVDKRGFGNLGPFRQFKRMPTAAIERGDLLIFYIGDDYTVYVKRVIGLPGDRVTLEGRQLTINNVPIPAQVARSPVQVGRFQYQLASETIDGREVTIAWLPDRPSFGFDGVVPEGHYFMLGDNRDNARDSRFADIGFIPKEKMIGRVVKVFAAQ